MNPPLGSQNEQDPPRRPRRRLGLSLAQRPASTVPHRLAYTRDDIAALTARLRDIPDRALTLRADPPRSPSQ